MMLSKPFCKCLSKHYHLWFTMMDVHYVAWWHLCLKQTGPICSLAVFPTQLACAFPIALDLLNGDRSRGHSRAAHGSISAHATSRKRSRQQTAKNIAEQQDRDQTTGQRLKLGPCPKAPHGDGHQARQRPGCLTLPDLFHRVRGHPERRYTPEYPGGIQAMASEQTTGKDHRSTSGCISYMACCRH